MNISQKIYLNPDNINSDKHIKIKLEQETNMLEFLSLKITNNDIYQSFNADYGVLIGRVIANNGIGVPNAKISIFIPLSDEDELNDDIRYIYPYKTPRDKNNEGKRYNLLPRVGKTDPKTNIIHPIQPFGSFPIKEEIVSNINQLNVYKKYYKYTALTNEFGDYMIFGTPIGTQTVHMSLDITDIGEYSMTPASMINNLGYSPNLFNDNGTRVKSSDDLNDLPHIETQEITVDIIPFWGDITNYEIGITRLDFRVKTTINNTFIIFGNVFTDGSETMWGGNVGDQIKAHELFYIDRPSDLNIITKRGAKVNENIYYYPPNITDDEIDAGNIDPNKIMKLDKSEYSRYVNETGMFTFIVNCNRKRIVNIDNSEVVIDYNDNRGIFTEFKGFIIFDLEYESAKMDFHRNIGSGERGRLEPFRYRLKFPQNSPYNHNGNNNYNLTDSPVNNGDTFDLNDENPKTIKWRNQYQTFSGGTIYTVSRFHGMSYYKNETTNPDYDSNTLADGMMTLSMNKTNEKLVDPLYNVGIIQTELETVENGYDIPANYSGLLSGVSPIITNTIIISNDELDLYGNMISKTLPYVFYVTITIGDKTKSITPNFKYDNIGYFGANWLNMSIYFPQIGELVSDMHSANMLRSNNHFSKNFVRDYDGNTGANANFFYNDNSQNIGGGDISTKWMARSDINKTGFAIVSKEDINKFIDKPNGFVITDDVNNIKLTGSYFTNESDIVYIPQQKNKYYFYKGFGFDCVKFLKTIGVV